MLLVKQWHMQKLTKSLKAKERKINKNDYTLYMCVCLCVYALYWHMHRNKNDPFINARSSKNMHEQYISSKNPAGGIEIGCLSL